MAQQYYGMLVRTNEIDAGVLIERVLPEDIVFRPIRVYKSYLVLQRGHPLVRRGVPKVTELLREDIVRRYPLVVAEKNDPDDNRLEDTLARHNLPFNVALEAGTEETLKYYVLRGLGIAVLSGTLTHLGLPAGRARCQLHLPR